MRPHIERHGKWCILALSAALFACTSGTTEAELETPLSGSWLWVESVGGIAGMQRSPDTEGYTVRLDFQGRRVRAFRSGQLVGQASFTVIEDTRYAGPMPVYDVEYSPALTAFRFSTLDQHTLRFTGTSSAQFNEGCCDRYLHTMIRTTN
jgi:hypothetical protein